MSVLSDKERHALKSFAKQFGRNWKVRLRKYWEVSDYPSCFDDFKDTLQHLRNASYFGPKGLERVRLQEIE